ncbi:MAG: flagellar biosynthesis anti-sigma factor FlgM [Pseudomonadota bacterium]
MPSVELNKLQGVSAPRALQENDRPQVDAGQRNGTSKASGSEAKPGVAVEVGATIDAGTPPVDTERVAEIRAALREGSYPLVPTKIADAMIAARIGPTVAQG